MTRFPSLLIFFFWFLNIHIFFFLASLCHVLIFRPWMSLSELDNHSSVSDPTFVPRGNSYPTLHKVHYNRSKEAVASMDGMLEKLETAPLDMGSRLNIVETLGGVVGENNKGEGDKLDKLISLMLLKEQIESIEKKERDQREKSDKEETDKKYHI